MIERGAGRRQRPHGAVGLEPERAPRDAAGGSGGRRRARAPARARSRGRSCARGSPPASVAHGLGAAAPRRQATASTSSARNRRLQRRSPSSAVGAPHPTRRTTRTRRRPRTTRRRPTRGGWSRRCRTPARRTPGSRGSRAWPGRWRARPRAGRWPPGGRRPTVVKSTMARYTVGLLGSGERGTRPPCGQRPVSCCRHPDRSPRRADGPASVQGFRRGAGGYPEKPVVACFSGPPPIRRHQRPR